MRKRRSLRFTPATSWQIFTVVVRKLFPSRTLGALNLNAKPIKIKEKKSVSPHRPFNGVVD